MKYPNLPWVWSDQGYHARFATGGEEPPHGHFMGGIHEIPGAVCGGCKRPFLLMMALDPRDTRLGLEPLAHIAVYSPHGPIIPLLYCWRCGGVLQYRLRPKLPIKVCDWGDPGGDDSPYEHYPSAFERRRLCLEPIPEDAQAFILKENRDQSAERGGPYEFWRQPRHQIGGVPYLIQGPHEEVLANCRDCEGGMKLLACVADDTGSERGYTDDAYVQTQFMICASCAVFCVMNECD